MREHEIILIPTFQATFGNTIYIIGLSKVGIKLLNARMFSCPKILFLVSLLFPALLNSIPTCRLNFYYFIILVCLLFIHAKHS